MPFEPPPSGGGRVPPRQTLPYAVDCRNLERLIENVATPGGITEAGIRFPDKARVEDILNAMVVHRVARIGSIRGQFTSAAWAR